MRATGWGAECRGARLHRAPAHFLRTKDVADRDPAVDRRGRAFSLTKAVSPSLSPARTSIHPTNPTHPTHLHFSPFSTIHSSNTYTMSLTKSIAAQYENADADEEDQAASTDAHPINEMDGVNEGDLKKLRDAGVFTIEGIHSQTRKELTSIKGFSDAKVDKLLVAASKIVDPLKFEVGTDVLARQANAARISTGSDELDGILGGGFELGKMTEIFGEAGAGKTQLLKTLAIKAQVSDNAGKVVWIDTEGAFSATRISDIATAMDMDAGQVLDNISFYSAKTHDLQLQAPAACKALFAGSEFPYRLIIIDSMMACFRSEFNGRGELSGRQQKLCRHLKQWSHIAQIHNCAIIYSNQICADPGNMFVPNAYKPIGGNIMAHACHLRMEMKGNKKDGKRVCRVKKSASLAYGECEIMLVDGGIANYA